jgi:hypothetical protein
MRPNDVSYHWLRRFGWRVRNPQSLVYAARIIFFGALQKDLPNFVRASDLPAHSITAACVFGAKPSFSCAMTVSPKTSSRLSISQFWLSGRRELAALGLVACSAHVFIVRAIVV